MKYKQAIWNIFLQAFFYTFLFFAFSSFLLDHFCHFDNDIFLFFLSLFNQLRTSIEVVLFEISSISLLDQIAFQILLSNILKIQMRKYCFAFSTFIWASFIYFEGNGFCWNVITPERQSAVVFKNWIESFSLIFLFPSFQILFYYFKIKWILERES